MEGKGEATKSDIGPLSWRRRPGLIPPSCGGWNSSIKHAVSTVLQLRSIVLGPIRRKRSI